MRAILQVYTANWDTDGSTTYLTPMSIHLCLSGNLPTNEVSTPAYGTSNSMGGKRSIYKGLFPLFYQGREAEQGAKYCEVQWIR